MLVLPKWAPGPPRKHPGLAGSVDLLAPDGRRAELVRELGDAGPRKVAVERAPAAAAALHGDLGRRGDRDCGSCDAAQLLKPAAGARAGGRLPGGLLIARRAPGREAAPATYLIADPDLLNNQGLDQEENAEAVFEFLVHDLAATSVVFDETIHGYNRVPGLLAEATALPDGARVLQSLLLLGVVLWAGMGRFGKPLPADRRARRRQGDPDRQHGEAAGGRRPRRRQPAPLFRGRRRASVAAHYFLPPDLPESERLARLQRLTDGHAAQRRTARGLNLAALERSLALLPDGARGEEQAARIARRLYDWRLEMTAGKMTATNASGPESSAS